MKYKCNDILCLIPSYVDNMTNQIESAMVSEHIAECAQCRREYDFLKSIMETTQELPCIKLSEDFNNKLHLNLVEAKKIKSKKALVAMRKIALATLSSAAVIAISIVSLSALDKKDIETIPTPKTIAHQSAENNAGNKKMVSQEPTEEPSSENETIETAKERAQEAKSTPAPVAAKADSPKKTAEPAENVPSMARSIEHKEVTEAPEEITPASSETSSSNSASDVYSLDSSNETVAPAASGGGTSRISSAYTGPKKTKVTATIKTNAENKDAVNKILSEYTYSNGAYVLSPDEYKKVLGELDSYGIYASYSNEDKTADYASLTAQLEGASKSEASDIQNRLNEIDNEVSKNYIKVN